MKKTCSLAGALLCITALAGCGGKTGAPSTPEPTPAETKAAPIEHITTKTGVDMVRIPGGTFAMGDPAGNDDEKPQHTVTISGFLMDTHEVTQEHFESLMGRNPAKFKSPDHPVEQLGWFGAIKYCNMRSLREGLTPCYDLDSAACNFEADGYRLPTEAEWEYACRAGTTTPYYFGKDARQLASNAWFEENAGDSTQQVGRKAPNPWGLYDMCGNVWEWCNDLYSDSYYSDAQSSDPCNTTQGEERVLRGGGWDSPAEMCRSAARYSEEPGLADVCFGYEAYGFRCVRRDTGGIPPDNADAAMNSNREE